jgi:hypothetical protein
MLAEVQAVQKVRVWLLKITQLVQAGTQGVDVPRGGGAEFKGQT